MSTREIGGMKSKRDKYSIGVNTFPACRAASNRGKPLKCATLVSERLLKYARALDALQIISARRKSSYRKPIRIAAS